jgi:cold shock protein
VDARTPITRPLNNPRLATHPPTRTVVVGYTSARQRTESIASIVHIQAKHIGFNFDRLNCAARGTGTELDSQLGPVCPPTEDDSMPNGSIKRLVRDRGFGFIRDDNGLEWFFHRTAVTDGTFDQLNEGQRVSFEEEPSAKGPRAGNVRGQAA